MKFIELTYAISGIKALFKVDTIELVVEGMENRTEIYTSGGRILIEESFDTVKKLLEGAEERILKNED